MKQNKYQGTFNILLTCYQLENQGIIQPLFPYFHKNSPSSSTSPVLKHLTILSTNTSIPNPSHPPFLLFKMLNIATWVLLISITAMNSTLFFAAFCYNGSPSPAKHTIHLPKSEQKEQVRVRTRSRRRPRRGQRSRS